MDRVFIDRLAERPDPFTVIGGFMDDDKIEGSLQRQGTAPRDDPDAADRDAGYQDGELDELYFGITNDDEDPQPGGSGSDQSEDDDPGS
jgi:hypothetical protein